MKLYTNPLDYMLCENIDLTLPEKPIDSEVKLPEHETEEKTEKELSTLRDELEKINVTITELKSKYPEDTSEEIAKALDDATSAIDLAIHHLSDIKGDIETDIDKNDSKHLDIDFPEVNVELDEFGDEV